MPNHGTHCRIGFAKLGKDSGILVYGFRVGDTSENVDDSDKGPLPMRIRTRQTEVAVYISARRAMQTAVMIRRCSFIPVDYVPDVQCRGTSAPDLWNINGRVHDGLEKIEVWFSVGDVAKGCHGVMLNSGLSICIFAVIFKAIAAFAVRERAESRTHVLFKKIVLNECEFVITRVLVKG